MTRQPTVFISSCHRGFEQHRRTAERIVQTVAWGAQPLTAVTTETGGATARPPLESSLERVRDASLVVLLVGFRYGTLAPGDHKKRSYVEAEYDEALHHGKPLLVFLARSKRFFDRAVVDVPQRRIELFRERIRTEQADHYTIQEFDDLDEFEQVFRTTLHSELPRLSARSRLAPAPRRVSDVRLAEEIVHPFGGMTRQTLFGRENDLAKIDRWLCSTTSSTLVLEAEGGMGKTSLAWSWFQNADQRIVTVDPAPVIAGRFWWSCYERGATLAKFSSQLRKWLEAGFPIDQHSDERDHWTAIHDYLRAMQHPPLIVIDGLEAEFIGYEGRRPEAAPPRRASNAGPSQSFAVASFMASDSEEDDFADFVDDNAREGLSLVITGGHGKLLITTRHVPRSFHEISNPLAHLKGLQKHRVQLLEPSSAKELMVSSDVSAHPETFDRILALEALRHPLLLAGFSRTIKNDPLANGDLDRFLSTHPDFNPAKLLRKKRSDILQWILEGINDLEKKLLTIIATSDRPMPAKIVVHSAMNAMDCTESEAVTALLHLEQARSLIHSSEAQVGRTDKSYSMHPVYRMYIKRYRLVDFQRMAASIRPAYEEEIFRGIGRSAIEVSVEQLDDNVMPTLDLCVAAREFDYAWHSYSRYLIHASEYFGFYKLFYDRIRHFVAFEHEHGELRAQSLVKDSTESLDVLWRAGELFKLFDDVEQSIACWRERLRLLETTSTSRDEPEIVHTRVNLCSAEARVSDAEYTTREVIACYRFLLEKGANVQGTSCLELALYRQNLLTLLGTADALIANEQALRFNALAGFSVLASWPEVSEDTVAWLAMMRRSLPLSEDFEAEQRTYQRTQMCVRRSPRNRLLLAGYWIETLLDWGKVEPARILYTNATSDGTWRELDLKRWFENIPLQFKIMELEAGRGGPRDRDNVLQLYQGFCQLHRMKWTRWQELGHGTWMLRLMLVGEPRPEAETLLDRSLSLLRELKPVRASRTVRHLRRCAERLGAVTAFEQAFSVLPEEYDLSLLRSEETFGIETAPERISPLAWQ